MNRQRVSACHCFFDDVDFLVRHRIFVQTHTNTDKHNYSHFSFSHRYVDGVCAGQTHLSKRTAHALLDKMPALTLRQSAHDRRLTTQGDPLNLFFSQYTVGSSCRRECCYRHCRHSRHCRELAAGTASLWDELFQLPFQDSSDCLAHLLYFYPPPIRLPHYNCKQHTWKKRRTQKLALVGDNKFDHKKADCCL